MSIKRTFTVRSFDVGPGGRLVIRALLNYLQDTAGQHAAQLGVSWERMKGEGLAWVMHRMIVRMEPLPRMNEQIQIETWPSDFRTSRAQRDFLVCDDDGQRVAAAVSEWLVMRLETRRLTRVPPWIRDIPVMHRERALPSDALEELEDYGNGVEHRRTFEARHDDLDLLGHVNNSRYGAFVAESLPESLVNGSRLAQLDLVFRNESRFGDRIVAKSREVCAGAFRHRLSREKDGKTLVDAASRWTPAFPKAPTHL